MDNKMSAVEKAVKAGKKHLATAEDIVLEKIKDLRLFWTELGYSEKTQDRLVIASGAVLGAATGAGAGFCVAQYAEVAVVTGASVGAAAGGALGLTLFYVWNASARAKLMEDTNKANFRNVKAWTNNLIRTVREKALNHDEDRISAYGDKTVRRQTRTLVLADSGGLLDFGDIRIGVIHQNIVMEADLVMVYTDKQAAGLFKSSIVRDLMIGLDYYDFQDVAGDIASVRLVNPNTAIGALDKDIRDYGTGLFEKSTTRSEIQLRRQSGSMQAACNKIAAMAGRLPTDDEYLETALLCYRAGVNPFCKNDCIFGDVERSEQLKQCLGVSYRDLSDQEKYMNVVVMADDKLGHIEENRKGYHVRPLRRYDALDDIPKIALLCARDQGNSPRIPEGSNTEKRDEKAPLLEAPIILSERILDGSDDAPAGETPDEERGDEQVLSCLSEALPANLYPPPTPSQRAGSLAGEVATIEQESCPIHNVNAHTGGSFERSEGWRVEEPLGVVGSARLLKRSDNAQAGETQMYVDEHALAHSVKGLHRDASVCFGKSELEQSRAPQINRYLQVARAGAWKLNDDEDAFEDLAFVADCGTKEGGQGLVVAADGVLAAKDAVSRAWRYPATTLATSVAVAGTVGLATAGYGPFALFSIGTPLVSFGTAAACFRTVPKTVVDNSNRVVEKLAVVVFKCSKYAQCGQRRGIPVLTPDGRFFVRRLKCASTTGDFDEVRFGSFLLSYKSGTFTLRSPAIRLTPSGEGDASRQVFQTEMERVVHMVFDDGPFRDFCYALHAVSPIKDEFFHHMNWNWPDLTAFAYALRASNTKDCRATLAICNPSNTDEEALKSLSKKVDDGSALSTASDKEVIAAYRFRCGVVSGNVGAFGSIAKEWQGVHSNGLPVWMLKNRERLGRVLILADGTLGRLEEARGKDGASLVRPLQTGDSIGFLEDNSLRGL